MWSSRELAIIRLVRKRSVAVALFVLTAAVAAAKDTHEPDAQGSPAAGKTPAPPPMVDDPIDVLYRRSLLMDETGEPVATIRLMEGQTTIRVRVPSGRLAITPRSAPDEPVRRIKAPSGTTVVLSLIEHSPGAVLRFPIVAELPAGMISHAAVVEEVARWRNRGHEVRLETVGSVFGLGGEVLDNRRVLVLLDGPGSIGWAREAAEEASSYLMQSPVFHEVRTERPSASIGVSDSEGSVLAVADGHVLIEVRGGEVVEVLGVEHSVGYARHGREDRLFEGSLHVVVDDLGLSLVNEVAVEKMLRGIVPAETYASAHIEALKAQAVATRTDILAKVGVRHQADPALICAETHCQVYRGVGAAVGTTDDAILSTAGEVLVGDGGRLIDAVYSAMCGGHTESNETVWGTPPDPVLRGRLDLPVEGKWLRFAAGIGEAELEKWLAEDPPSWCRLASVGSNSRHRWTRSFTAEQIDGLVSSLGVGSIRAIEPLGRGVSGRVRGVRVTGTGGEAVVRRELPVRRLFDNLPSGMFVVRVEEDEKGLPVSFVFEGGGWGHGVGMCQTGAIGMAEHGHAYRSILRHYYNGAEVQSICR